MNKRDFRMRVFRKASLCRNFEDCVFQNLQKKNISLPVYMSAGQEYIPATLSEVFKDLNPYIFAQHRCHSWYLSFGGDILSLIDELLGRETGCAYGMGGSASIHSPENNMFGHDGLMGSQVPIAVGSCYSNKMPTIAVMGDASAEEDYVFGALGWASTKELPILFVVEDNNLSILTEKRVRRKWEMDAVATAFQMEGHDINDDPIDILNHCEETISTPRLLNIKTHRLYWHAGAGIDDPDIFDRYKHEMNTLGDEAIEIHNLTKEMVQEAWRRQLEIR
jgi:TPP-dependent pyruvate/acetoin dehydrogenase alpha subunit|tara:strand:+ start:3742 stop:4575 length:834 start_codon:yes stop_codon:yes gene_type:complete